MVNSYQLTLTKQVDLKQYIFNPFIFTGITGHILISKVYDRSTRSYTVYTQAREPDLSKFQIFIVLDHETAEFNRGTMTVTPKFSGILYHIETFDNTVQGDLEILIQERSIVFIDNITIKKGLLGRRTQSELMSHVINDHIEPFLASLGIKTYDS
ncbi:hypothetical protein SJAV_19900 [Sulfurisphaera javensis]|uniref:DUF3211 domain-containing protein n=1 Tax=Sulfurisphaera javensis TaxID=2049879 RepID=A0AAT9GSX7_9CREN